MCFELAKDLAMALVLIKGPLCLASLQEVVIGHRVRIGHGAVWRERRHADTCAEPIPVMFVVCQPQLMTAWFHRW